jgi:hypothetical protein
MTDPSESISLNTQENQLSNKTAGTTTAGSDLSSDEEKDNALIESLQVALNISKEEMATMITGEHFNHQY